MSYEIGRFSFSFRIQVLHGRTCFSDYYKSKSVLANNATKLPLKKNYGSNVDQSIKNLNVILLIAGSGRRISNVTRKPKCLIELNKQSILYKNFSLWKKIGLKKSMWCLAIKVKL